MLNDINRPALSTGRLNGSVAARMVIVPKEHTMGPVRKAVYRVVMTLGVLAMTVLAILFIRPELADHLKVASPFASAVIEELQAEEDSHPLAVGLMPVSADDPTLQAQQERLSQWIARRYRVAGDATNMFVSTAYSTAQEMEFDPLLILAVIAIESRFNPFAESPVGAQGLMQVMSKVHQEKFEEHGGVKAALNPIVNIKVGTRILHEYIRRGGSVEAGLKYYVGAANMKTDQGYGAKVLQEYRRLKDVAGGKKVPIFTRSASAQKQDPAQNLTEVAAGAA
jgi:soluble lytic murein transglycosylase-like protein